MNPILTSHVIVGRVATLLLCLEKEGVEGEKAYWGETADWYGEHLVYVWGGGMSSGVLTLVRV